jgi:hypothetical protein
MECDCSDSWAGGKEKLGDMSARRYIQEAQAINRWLPTAAARIQTRV